MLNGEPWLLLPSTSYPVRLCLVSLVVLAIPAWAWLVLKRARPGWPRVVAALPCLVGLIFAPFLVCVQKEVLERIMVAYLTERLPLPKILAYCLGRGPLVDWEDRTFMQFLSVTLFPIVPAASPPSHISNDQQHHKADPVPAAQPPTQPDPPNPASPAPSAKVAATASPRTHQEAVATRAPSNALAATISWCWGR
ncbi:hypothetical protein V8C86DRAFT_2764652 [Haematococcus lacustris]